MKHAHSNELVDGLVCRSQPPPFLGHHLRSTLGVALGHLGMMMVAARSTKKMLGG